VFIVFYLHLWRDCGHDCAARCYRLDILIQCGLIAWVYHWRTLRVLPGLLCGLRDGYIASRDGFEVPGSATVIFIQGYGRLHAYLR
jgi:hypothetical protein